MPYKRAAHIPLVTPGKPIPVPETETLLRDSCEDCAPDIFCPLSCSPEPRSRGSPVLLRWTLQSAFLRGLQCCALQQGAGQ